MLTESISSTDIVDLHFLDGAGMPVQPSTAEPHSDRGDLLTTATGILRDRQQQQNRTVHQRYELGRQPQDAFEETAEVQHRDELSRAQQGEEHRTDNHTDPVTQTADNGHQHEDQRELEVETTAHDR